MEHAPVRYSPTVEKSSENEADGLLQLQESFRHNLETTSLDYGHAARGVHAKDTATIARSTA